VQGINHTAHLHDCDNGFICRKKLTGIVAYIPQPVVAGYLGYVGYFCLVAGVSQGTGLPIHDPWSWRLLFTHTDAYLKEVATFASSAAIFFAINVSKSQAGLPTVLLIIPVLWYALLGCICTVQGTQWGDLQQWLSETGWVAPMHGGDAHEPFWKVRCC
jgi:MFS superfamily sulfate permease-like transporter